MRYTEAKLNKLIPPPAAETVVVSVPPVAAAAAGASLVFFGVTLKEQVPVFPELSVAEKVTSVVSSQ